ncbi:MAG: hypothetical protein LBB81_05475 [Treponema sp.]|jgi:thymidylate kinase|nr:hypothetical protein [Treponema sp.]
MDNQTIIYLCGPHTAGKTSIIKSLQDDSTIDYTGGEIGKELYYSRSLNTVKQDENFELEVTQLELKRDAFIFQNKYKISVVESWHTGNLAYAMVRNPHSAGKLVPLINTSPLLQRSYGIWLRVSKENIFKRTKTFSKDREWASEFYTLIDSKIESCFKMLNLAGYCVVDANRDLDIITRDVYNIIRLNIKE